MIEVALFPETPALGPRWACAEVRLLRPYRHPQMRRRLRCRVHHGDALELGLRTNAVVIQRGGPVEMTLDALIGLVHEASRRRLPIIYDLDDDLLAGHPVPGVEAFLRGVRPKVRYLLRAAAVVVVSTKPLAERVAHLARKVAVWPNALDEGLLDAMRTVEKDRTRRVDVGYMGTPTHLQDLMSVVPSIGGAISAMQNPPRIELLGVADDARVGRLWQGRAAMALSRADGDYGGFMRRLAGRCWGVGLAPLADAPFNACKSDIKFLDYGAAGIPGIFADGPVYGAAQAHDAGLLSSPESFGSKILTLLADDGLRDRLARNAWHHVRDQRCLVQAVPRLWRIIESCLDLPAA